MNPQIRKRGLLNLRFVSILTVVMFLILTVAYFFWGLGPNLEENGEVLFKISKGEGLREISAHLSRGELIKSISVFKIYSLMSGSAQKFQPGVHELSPAMSVPQILGELTSFDNNEVSVTFPEGSTLKDVDMILADNIVIEKGAVLSFSIKDLEGDYEFLSQADSLEGFIFPDTYRFEVASGAEAAIRRILDNFGEKAWPLLKNENNWYDLLILASFLEREVPDFDDRQIVAGIIFKRISLGIPLQIDATLSYLKCEGQFRGCEDIIVTKSDLDISSPYNTYKRLGFTPTPISNPGESAIRAATEPVKSPYLYYLSARKTGETIFSKTLEEHNENRVKFL